MRNLHTFNLIAAYISGLPVLDHVLTPPCVLGRILGSRHVQQEERVLSLKLNQVILFPSTRDLFNTLLRASQGWSVLHLDLWSFVSESSCKTLALEAAKGRIGTLSLPLRGGPKIFSRGSGRSQGSLCGWKGNHKQRLKLEGGGKLKQKLNGSAS